MLCLKPSSPVGHLDESPELILGLPWFSIGSPCGRYTAEQSKSGAVRRFDRRSGLPRARRCGPGLRRPTVLARRLPMPHPFASPGQLTNFLFRHPLPRPTSLHRLCAGRSDSLAPKCYLLSFSDAVRGRGPGAAPAYHSGPRASAPFGPSPAPYVAHSATGPSLRFLEGSSTFRGFARPCLTPMSATFRPTPACPSRTLCASGAFGRTLDTNGRRRAFKLRPPPRDCRRNRNGNPGPGPPRRCVCTHPPAPDPDVTRRARAAAEPGRNLGRRRRRLGLVLGLGAGRGSRAGRATNRRPSLVSIFIRLFTRGGWP